MNKSQVGGIGKNQTFKLEFRIIVDHLPKELLSKKSREFIVQYS